MTELGISVICNQLHGSKQLFPSLLIEFDFEVLKKSKREAFNVVIHYRIIVFWKE
jgi:hypothetical protein